MDYDPMADVQASIPPQQGQLPPDQQQAAIQAMLALNSMGPKQAQMQRQQQLANQLRAQAPGMMRSSSSISTPNWAGAIAGTMAGIKANQLDKQAEATGVGLGKDRAAAGADFLAALRGRQGMPPNPGAGVPMSPEGYY